jgi:hypothetical protein
LELVNLNSHIPTTSTTRQSALPRDCKMWNNLLCSGYSSIISDIFRQQASGQAQLGQWLQVRD